MGDAGDKTGNVVSREGKTWEHVSAFSSVPVTVQLDMFCVNQCIEWGSEGKIYREMGFNVI